MLEWNQVTWYSRMAAIIIFVGVIPVLNFYIGVQYQETNAALQRSVEAQEPTPVCPIVKAEPVSTTSATTTQTDSASARN